MDPVLTEHLKRQTFLLQRILATLDRLVELAEGELDTDSDELSETDLAGRPIG